MQTPEVAMEEDVGSLKRPREEEEEVPDAKRQKTEVPEIWLPDDLLLLIFSGFSRDLKSILASSLVSSTWKRVCGHASLRWVEVAKQAYISHPEFVFPTDIWERTVSGSHQTLMLNVHKFDQIVKNKERAFANEELHVLFYEGIDKWVQKFSNTLSLKVSKNSQNAHKPDQVYPELKQPARFKGTLYRYQLDAMSWMVNIEEHVGDDIPFNPLITWTPARSETLFKQDYKFKDYREYHKKYSLIPFTKAKKHTKNISTRGGVIADEMGLGKTIEVIALILANFVDEDDENVTGLNDNDNFISRATLIYCPSHLAKQWKDQIEKMTDPPLNVVTITTMREFNSHTAADLCRFDVVIVSFQFLNNKNYDSFCSSSKRNKTEDCDLVVPLKRICWHRIVWDEGHESIENPITSYDSSIRWYCTGTPFPNDYVKFGVVKFLIEGSEGVPASSYEAAQMFDIVYNNFYFRNTKKSISADEYSVPAYKTQFVWVDMPPTEKLLYNEYCNRHWEACANILHVNTYGTKGSNQCTPSPNREMLRRNMIDNFKRLLKQEKQRKKDGKKNIADREKEIEENEDKLAHSTDDEKRAPSNSGWNIHTMEALWKYRLDNAKRNLDYAKRNLETNKSEIISFSKSIILWEELEPEPLPSKDAAVGAPKFEPPEDLGYHSLPAPVEDLKTKQLNAALTARKLSTSGAKDQKVKRLETALEKEMKKIKVLKTEHKSIYPKTYSEQSLSCKLGAKKAKVLIYLRKLWYDTPDCKVIIFSKYDNVLEEFRNLLDAENVRSVWITGNVYSRNKALTAFEGDVKVMLLNLSSKASGTNLQQASQILLVDPMNGTPTEIKGIEGQAVARAHRHGQEKELLVVRFITRGTVEENHYTKIFGATEPQVPVSTGIPITPALERQGTMTMTPPSSPAPLQRQGTQLIRQPSLIRQSSGLKKQPSLIRQGSLLPTTTKLPLMIRSSSRLMDAITENSADTLTDLHADTQP